MNILKTISIILYLFIANGECGLVDTVLGTVKNTANALRADVHNFVAYGNDMVFGDGGHKHVVPGEGQAPEEPKTEGLITNMFIKAQNALSAVHQKVRNFMVKDDGAPHKGIISKICDPINKKLKGVQEYFQSTSDDPNKLLDKPIPNVYGEFVGEDTKVIRDKIIQMLYRNNTNVLSKLNISEVDIHNLLNDVKSTVKNDLVLPTTDKEKDIAYDIDVRSLGDNV